MARRYQWTVQWPPGRRGEAEAQGRRRAGRFTVRSSGRTLLLLAGAGFVTGWSVETRETAVFALPAIGWALWPLRRRALELAFFVAPVMCWLILDMALCAWIYGVPLLKLHILTGADISVSEVTSDVGYVGHSRLWYATILPRSIWHITGGPVLLAMLLIAAVGGFILRKRLGPIWAWGMLAGGMLWAQGGPLSPGHPAVRLDVDRYALAVLRRAARALRGRHPGRAGPTGPGPGSVGCRRDHPGPHRWSACPGRALRRQLRRSGSQRRPGHVRAARPSGGPTRLRAS